MGFLSRWKDRQAAEFQRRTDPYMRARNELWARESARLGEQEFNRRMAAVTAHQTGQGPASGFEEWRQQLDAEIMRRAHELAEGA